MGSKGSIASGPPPPPPKKLKLFVSSAVSSDYNLSINSQQFLKRTGNSYKTFTRKASKQHFSKTYDHKIDPRLLSFLLYKYQLNIVTNTDFNILIVSGTGSGKTEAAFFNVINQKFHFNFSPSITVFLFNLLLGISIQKYAS